MKDYTFERIYRDARITSIYEGTTQLQVVAAIRYATSGFYANVMKEFALWEVSPEMAPLKIRLDAMAGHYEKAITTVMAQDSQEFIDLTARRLVEMAGYIIMGYLLLQDASVNAELFTMDNFPYVISKMKYWKAMGNTAFITIMALILVIAFASLAGFAIARCRHAVFSGYYKLIVTLMGNEDELITGIYDVEWNNGDPTYSFPDLGQAYPYVTLRKGDKTPIAPGEYYFTILPVEFKKGFTLIFAKTDGTQVAVRTDKPVTTVSKRNQIQPMKEAPSSAFKSHMNYFVHYDNGFDLDIRYDQLTKEIIDKLHAMTSTFLRGFQAHGKTSDTALVNFGFKGFRVYKMVMKYDNIVMVDNYFTMYGYAIKRIGIPNRHARPYWTYIRTIGCKISGSIPFDHEDKICSIYDKGITFWNSIEQFGRYDLNNSPV